MTETEKAIIDFCGHHADWWPSTTQVQEMLALAQPEQEPVAKAWDEGYRQGVQDERISKANIGIAGFGAKVEPARQNPYGTTPPQRKPEQEPVAWHYPDGKPDQCTTNKAYAEMEPAWTPMYYKHEWVGLTDEEQTQVAWACGAMSADWLDFAQEIEAKLKEKNNG